MSTASPASPSAAYLLAERGGFRWYHVEDIHGPALVVLAAEFGLHELAIEDCRNERTRAKLEEYDGHIFLVANTVHFEARSCECWFGEFDIFVGRDFVITVHDGPSRTVAAVQPWFQEEAKLAHPGRLVYALLDVIVDRYIPVLDSIEERIELLEKQVYEEPSPKLLADIFAVKRALVDFRRTAMTMREVINQLLHRTEPWVRSQHTYFRDTYDQVLRALEFVESYRDILTGVLDVHLTATASRANNIMRVLTVFATLALPFLLVTGYFGMNFEDLPLLHRPGAALGVTAGMFGVAVVMLWWFRRRGWI